ncbi:MAG: HEAT repeat domain-containing protein, partial [Mariprofundaceae bacterium]
TNPVYTQWCVLTQKKHLKQNQNTSAAVMALPALMRGLANQNPKYRYFSAEALGMLGSRATGARQTLQTHLRDPDPRVRSAASRALKKIGGIY